MGQLRYSGSTARDISKFAALSIVSQSPPFADSIAAKLSENRVDATQFERISRGKRIVE